VALGAADEGARINRWWANEPAEIFWLEVSARGVDVGLDLNAPLLNERGRPFWSYDLVDHVAEGDVVLHYDRDERAILAWSIVVGSAWRDTVIWAARGTYARGLHIVPHERPGRRLSLNGPIRLPKRLTLERVRDVRPQLEKMRRDRPYFPFELGSRPVRPVQGYLFKLPAAFLELSLSWTVSHAQRYELLRRSPPRIRRDFGLLWNDRPSSLETRTYGRDRRARGCVIPPRSIVRSRRTLGSSGWLPKLQALRGGLRRRWGRVIRPSTSWWPMTGGISRIVVEVKSTTDVNEEKQLRLAMGQVLRYRQVLQATGRRVEAMIAVEHEPSDASWIELCREVGVLLAWPGVLDGAFRRMARRTQLRT
jgi:hypothetical protein